MVNVCWKRCEEEQEQEQEQEHQDICIVSNIGK